MKKYILMALCVFVPTFVSAQTIQSNEYMVWGIGSDSITIPAGSVITEAVLTIQNVVPQQTPLYIHLLDNADEGVVIGTDAGAEDVFGSCGVVLSGTYEDGNYVCRFSLNENAQSPIRSIYSAPTSVTLADTSAVQLSSALLELMDYAGNGRGFGIGLDPQTAEQLNLDIDNVQMEITLKSYSGAAAQEVLSLSSADSLAGPVVLEAEDAVLKGAVISTVVEGYTGSGFVDYVTASDEFTEWTVNISSAGPYKLEFCYALGAGNRPLRIEVNGVTVNASLDFSATGSWTTWKTVGAKVTLNSGVNTIRATSIGYSGANIDSLTVIPVDFGVYEAEDAGLSGAVVTSILPGYTGTGFVDYVTASGEYTEWTVNARDTGLYELKFCYGLAYGNRPLSIEVNGVIVNSAMAFNGSGSWTNWTTASMMTTLNAGSNTIRAMSIGSSGPNMDSLTIIGQ